MFIRVVSGVQSHFVERAIEWICAVNLIWWGSKLTGPNDAWSNVQAWAFMLSWFSENAWGWIFISLGWLRILALIINGTFANTWYSDASPWVRGVGAGLSATLWFMVFLSVSAVQTSGSGIYQLPLVLDLWCSFRVIYLIGRASKKAPKGNERVT